jgi:hypothetical protein
VRVRRCSDGERRDGAGNRVNGYQPHANARGLFRMCGVIEVGLLAHLPQRRHQVGSNVLWSCGMAMVPLGESVLRSPRLATVKFRPSCRGRAPSGRPAGRRRTRTAARDGPSDESEGDPEPGASPHAAQLDSPLVRRGRRR